MTSPTGRALPTGPTGRTIVVLDERETPAPDLLRRLGVSCVSARDLPRGGGAPGASATSAAAAPSDGGELPAGTAVVLDALGIAIMTEPPGILLEAAQDPGAAVVSAEPEVWVHATATPPVAPPAGGAFADTATAAWGLLATGVVGAGAGAASTPWDGDGVVVAVLDTGVDAEHPDLAGRIVTARSFVDGEGAHDRNGHGTHVAGTVAGAREPAGGGPRYGVAPGARLLVGKVLGDDGSGTSGGVLEGLNWAVEQGAHVVSMSLGTPVAVGEPHLRYYEAAARAALAAGTVVIAAAGNDGPEPVNSPANCPSVMAVAALDTRLRRADFSCIGLNGDGGEVDIAAPGVAILSAHPLALAPTAVLDGTSMATPHVSGLAALAAQATGSRGRDLWEHLVTTAAPLADSARDVGRGLAVAPPHSS
ncbi:S8 family serine peptidase [Litorihabitans aurantiacus]|uniref:Peptidase S8/S53 domain-containing protein n=1 Tax=Litorihabitans aurantiacus TaxID=1930061 RepID=A0AA38CW69_9MICO|nr:S8 family serine peptidase [Litorihabitans aurantiacus]GMA32727.1 hypothetical protein GCM10025875_27190 [Litorihabitans aurantiacus]